MGSQNIKCCHVVAAVLVFFIFLFLFLFYFWFFFYFYLLVWKSASFSFAYYFYQHTYDNGSLFASPIESLLSHTKHSHTHTSPSNAKFLNLMQKLQWPSYHCIENVFNNTTMPKMFKNQDKLQLLSQRSKKELSNNTMMFRSFGMVNNYIG